MVKDGEAWHAAVHGVARGKHDLATEQQQSTKRYLTLTGTLSMQRNQSQSSPGYVPLV